MCLAIPLQVIEVCGTIGDALQPPSAIVAAEGVKQEVRLDIIDHMPVAGDYVIVHAGFALHRLDEQQARENLALLEDLAAGSNEIC